MSLPPDPITALSPTQALAVDALLTGATQTEAARQAGVDVSTLRRWQHRVDFQEALHQGRTAFRHELTAGLCHDLRRAREVVLGLMDESENENVRLRAAQALFRLASGAMDSLDVHYRVRQLEAALDRITILNGSPAPGPALPSITDPEEEQPDREPPGLAPSISGGALHLSSENCTSEPTAARSPKSRLQVGACTATSARNRAKPLIHRRNRPVLRAILRERTHKDDPSPSMDAGAKPTPWDQDGDAVRQNH